MASVTQGLARGLKSGIVFRQEQQKIDLLKQRRERERVEKTLTNTVKALQEHVQMGPAFAESGVKFEDYSAMGKQLYRNIGRIRQALGQQTPQIPDAAIDSQLRQNYKTPAEMQQAELQAAGELAGVKSSAQHAAASSQLEQDVGKGLKSGASETFFQAFNPKTGDHIQSRGNNVEIQRLESQGYEIAPGAQQTGEKNPFATKTNMSRFTEQAGAAFEAVSAGNELNEALIKEPDANTAFAALARGVNEVRNEVQAVTNFFAGKRGELTVEGADGSTKSVSDSFNEWMQKDHSPYFKNLGQKSAETKAMLIGMAFRAAATREQGGRFSDKDIELAMKEIGADLSDPEVIVSNVNRMQRRVIAKMEFMGGLMFGADEWESRKADIKMPSIVTWPGITTMTEAQRKRLEELESKHIRKE